MRKKDLTKHNPFQGQQDDESGTSLSNLKDQSAINPETWQVRRENNRDLQTAINNLSLQHREIVVLRHVQNLSYHEIAGILNLPMNSVKVRLHRARAQLREFFEKK